MLRCRPLGILCAHITSNVLNFLSFNHGHHLHILSVVLVRQTEAVSKSAKLGIILTAPLFNVSILELTALYTINNKRHLF